MKNYKTHSTPPPHNKFVIFLCVSTILFASGFFTLFFREGYPQKIKALLFSSADTENYGAQKNYLLDAWENSLGQLHVKADVVFFGDSITRRGNFAELFPELTVCNLGLGSDTITGMTERVSMIATVSPNKVFIMGGVNSLEDDNITQCIREYDSLLRSISASCSADIYVLSMLPKSAEVCAQTNCTPQTIISFNEGIRRLSQQYGYDYIDLHSEFSQSDATIRPELTTDGVHITQSSYAIWVDHIHTYIENH